MEYASNVYLVAAYGALAEMAIGGDQEARETILKSNPIRTAGSYRRYSEAENQGVAFALGRLALNGDIEAYRSLESTKTYFKDGREKKHYEASNALRGFVSAATNGYGDMPLSQRKGILRIIQAFPESETVKEILNTVREKLPAEIRDMADRQAARREFAKKGRKKSCLFTLQLYVLKTP